MEPTLIAELADKLRARYPDAKVHTALGHLYLSSVPHMDVIAIYWVNSARAGRAPWFSAIRFAGMEWKAPLFVVPDQTVVKPDIRVTIRPDMWESSLESWTPYPIVTSFHTVEQGDTLASIATAADIAVEVLWERNVGVLMESMTGSPLTPGLVLEMP